MQGTKVNVMPDDFFISGKTGKFDEMGNRTSLRRRSTATDGLDTVFDLLCDSRRRYLLYCLVTVDGDVVEREAAVNAVRDYEAAGTEATDRSSREEIRNELYTDSLPRLGNAGVLDYDPRQGTVRFAGRPLLEEWVEHARDVELE